MAVISTGLTMNEKIKQFAEQAFRYSCEFAQDPNYSPHNPYNGLIEKERYDKKFAELIVRECTAALFDESERLSGLYSDENNWDSAEEYEIRSNQCIDDIALIEKHFGVEE